MSGNGGILSLGLRCFSTKSSIQALCAALTAYCGRGRGRAGGGGGRGPGEGGVGGGGGRGPGEGGVGGGGGAFGKYVRGEDASERMSVKEYRTGIIQSNLW
jgi:hypothetical protein